jgi:quinol monooxygenase YgiN
MIKRLVLLVVKQESIADFEYYFSEIKNRVIGVKGCEHLELLKDTAKPHVYFTLSIWSCQEDLQAYLSSALFKQLWPEIKKHLAERAVVWSLNIHE